MTPEELEKESELRAEGASVAFKALGWGTVLAVVPFVAGIAGLCVKWGVSTVPEFNAKLGEFMPAYKGAFQETIGPVIDNNADGMNQLATSITSSIAPMFGNLSDSIQSTLETTVGSDAVNAADTQSDVQGTAPPQESGAAGQSE
eukprot:GFYU01031415.1.p1 GENE.GFYU01031415.1~~GFYU01031415.1.p1  ORF type:complete len:145 (+),score=39.74 GFYU01031415.1:3-437(+)